MTKATRKPTGATEMSNSTLYDHDFYAWANEQARLLRDRRFDDADLANIIEEIETLGRSEMRELVSRLRVLLMHLLKWQYQPNFQGPSWRTSIIVQRSEIAEHLRESPSLQARLDEAVARAYQLARLGAAMETGQAKQTFPETCPWSFEQMMAEDFWPGAG